MIGSGPRLYPLDVTAESWTRRYGVLPFDGACQRCARPCTTSRPFACGEMRGLAAPDCICGETRMPYAVVRDPKHGDLLDLRTDLATTTPVAQKRSDDT